MLARKKHRFTNIQIFFFFKKTPIFPYSLDDVRREYGSMHALGRCGEAEDVARAIAFLASDKSAFVTGSHLVVDGGNLVQV